ncbi:DUF1364 domain-containing protein [Pseudomonas sp. JQ170]|uniref:DUF1364 domain-containing protein n=1 Tax=unclassified Pseudomonas TaxID=196821 RepID=UPI00264D069A|nr:MULTISPECIES: DUF1364 domain-containing protein [unclassified Pseudomonas]MDN7144074.1 DUF1364 domain-containing protein [Pseudomonas sp. JQ170]WRO74207.1 DUF1364 domain-containing protein [Pseudomonas sp. 170C]
MKQSKLTKAARGRECQVRIPGVCNGNPETTVLAHYRMSGTCGVGMKPNDLQGAWACSACHDACDSRSRLISREEARQYHAEGVMRTQAVLISEGVVAGC